MTSASTTGKKRKWPTWLLIGSLALNLLIVGAIVGFAVRAPHERIGSAPNMPGAISLLRAVPDSHKSQVRAAFFQQREKLRANRREIGNLRNRFLDVIEQDPLDVAALEALLADHARIEADLSQSGRDLLLETVTNMDLEARKSLAARARAMTQRQNKDRKPRP